MKSKTFFLTALFCALALLLGTAGLVAWVDPMLTGGLEEGETALFVNERYEMAGLIRHQDYEDIVMGTWWPTTGPPGSPRARGGRH